MSASPFATCDLCDEYKTDGSGAFRVLPPVFRDFGARTVFGGPVSTVKCFEDNTLVKAAVDSPGWVDTPQGRVGKVLVVDGLLVSVGSTNFDNRSFRLNDEANLNVFDAGLAARLAGIFAQDLRQSHALSLQAWQRRP